MIYGNAWDNVPSIQRYVSRLARPASFLPVDLPPPTPPSHFRRQSKTFAEAPEPGEASSRDGDDEDEIGESEADEPVIVGKHDKGHKGVDAAVGNSKAPGVRSPPKPRSRSGSKSGSGSGSRSSDGKSRYRSFGIQAKPNTTEREVQTLATPPTTRSPRVSTALPVATPSPSNKGKGPQPWPMHPATQPTVLSHTGYAPGETVPTGVTSPRMHDYAFSSPSNFAAPQAQNAIASTPSMISPPDITASPLANTDVHLRGSSSDSYLTSASTASSLPVQSPIDEQSVPRRVPAGRKWDPARGVDIFKRDSQEVLAKFLRMGSWENQQTVG
jgi:glycogenin glucosyltransferase